MINSKGSMLDFFAVVVILFGSMIAILMGVYINDAVYDDPTVNATFSTRATDHILTSNQILYSFDGLIVILMFGGAAASIISAFLIRSHPAFFIVAFLFQLIMVGISTVFSNIYWEFANTSELAAIANLFPNTALIMGNLPVILLVISGLVAIVMYGKATGGEQYAY